MSILIKGMEMPKHCGYCRFRYDGICHALQKTQYAETDCPLIEVPTPHGDLEEGYRAGYLDGIHEERDKILNMILERANNED